MTMFELHFRLVLSSLWTVRPFSSFDAAKAAAASLSTNYVVDIIDPKNNRRWCRVNDYFYPTHFAS
jgi:hypothetical protein